MEEFDETDARILNVLQKTGRISNADLADRINLSQSACHRRVARLEAVGIIRDYVALLDPRKLDRPTTVFVEITLSGQADEVLDAFEKAVARVPDVLECHLMAGTADYLLKVVAGDTEDFAKITLSQIRVAAPHISRRKLELGTHMFCAHVQSSSKGIVLSECIPRQKERPTH